VGRAVVSAYAREGVAALVHEALVDDRGARLE
jgi:hypothetical protein